MEDPLKQPHAHFLISLQTNQLTSLLEQAREKLSPLTGPILLAEKSLVHFVAVFLSAVYLEKSIFLLDPDALPSQFEEALDALKPQIVFRDLSFVEYKNFASFDPYIGIPTGGTCGKLRFALHTWISLSASVFATAQFLKKPQLDSCSPLPLYHVSGLMPLLRALLTQGSFYSINLKAPLPSFDFSSFCLSLVPTQLERLLSLNDNLFAIQWLQQFHTIFLGGAPARRELLEKAKQTQINLAITYGMTETASMVSCFPPPHFASTTSVGKALPGYKITTTDSDQIQIESLSLFSGYFPHPQKITSFIASDFGYIDSDNFIYIRGRSDRIIITGGQKVNPSEIENAILETGFVSDVLVLGQNHVEWGEQVTAIFVPAKKFTSIEMIQKNLRLKLNGYKIPKTWIPVDTLPLDPKGKIDYNRALRLLTLV